MYPNVTNWKKRINGLGSLWCLSLHKIVSAKLLFFSYKHRRCTNKYISEKCSQCIYGWAICKQSNDRRISKQSMYFAFSRKWKSKCNVYRAGRVQKRWYWSALQFFSVSSNGATRGRNNINFNTRRTFFVSLPRKNICTCPSCLYLRAGSNIICRLNSYLFIHNIRPYIRFIFVNTKDSQRRLR